MDSSGGSASASTQSDDIEDTPLWRFVDKGPKLANGGGNASFRCHFCNLVRGGTYTRVRAHLLKIPGKGVSTCENLSIDDQVKLKQLDDAVEAKKRAAAKPKVPLFPNESSSSDVNSRQPHIQIGKKRKSINTIPMTLNIQSRNHLDAEIARMFYTGGLPFNLARNPYYVRSYSFAASNQIPGYTPPGYNKLRTTLLQQEKQNVERLLEPIKSTWKEKGVSVVSDGWSDSQRRPLINVMVACESGPMFIKAVDCSGEVKDKEYIASLLSEVIDEVGDQNVVQVLTDNASNCKGAGELIEGRYSHIYWTPCVVHTLNLALKNICAARNTNNNEETYNECHWITEIHVDALFIKNYIMTHGMRLAIFNKFSPLKLLSVADTRFASIVVMLKRLKLLKTSLQSMVVSEAWTTYREDRRGQAVLVREKILDDGWWDKVDYILEFTRPIYNMIRDCDTDRSSLHLVYERWEGMSFKVKEAIYKHEHKCASEESTFFKVVESILTSRWSKTSTPLHSLAHSLVPRFYTQKWLDEIPGRVAPHVDNEVSSSRLSCFRRLFPCADDRRKANTEYAIFSRRDHDIFKDLECVEDMSLMEAKHWWATYGSIAPNLQGLAFKLLGQPSSSSCSERNWSIYKFIHSCTRNRLTPKRAEDLVRIHNNLRLLSRNSEEYIKGRTKMWDVGGDEHDNLDEVGCLDVANLSLDEPDMEMMLFGDDGEIGDFGELDDRTSGNDV
ncbi:uncharacterized protein LOC141643211 [Silene latifolia]|uniref:uncharacterized protein LOC141643211 n=1 Tax=Silene latifolia TaxID=37657 RepID=UPI003D77A8A6